MIYLGADHGGFKKKEEIKLLLKEMGVAFEDLGNTAYDPNDDYPVFAQKVAEAVSENPKKHKGILLCRSGVGVDIVANKFPDVRSALVASRELAQLSRMHDDSNVLALASDYLTESETRQIVKVWLNSPFTGEDRLVRRLEKNEENEKTLRKKPTPPAQ